MKTLPTNFSQPLKAYSSINHQSIVELTAEVTLEISDEVLRKIHKLNSIMPNVEWSGILLYSHTGSIKDPRKMVLTVQDIIFMNKGTATYTEYSFTEAKRDSTGFADRHIDYCNEVEEAIFWSIGHIHSHNNMAVFFSGTDQAELVDNAPLHNIYLSLIVNNKLDLMAKVAYAAKAEAEVAANYVALDEEGNQFVVSGTTLRVTKEKTYANQCKIKADIQKIFAEETIFDRNIREVLKTPDKVNYYQGAGFSGKTNTFPAKSNPFVKEAKPFVPKPYYAPEVSEEEEFDAPFSAFIFQFVIDLFEKNQKIKDVTEFENKLKAYSFLPEYVKNSKIHAKNVIKDRIRDLITEQDLPVELESELSIAEEALELLDLFITAYEDVIKDVFDVVFEEVDEITNRIIAFEEKEESKANFEQTKNID